MNCALKMRRTVDGGECRVAVAERARAKGWEPGKWGAVSTPLAWSQDESWGSRGNFGRQALQTPGQGPLAMDNRGVQGHPWSSRGQVEGRPCRPRGPRSPFFCFPLGKSLTHGLLLPGSRWLLFMAPPGSPSLPISFLLGPDGQWTIVLPSHPSPFTFNLAAPPSMSQWRCTST